MLFDEIKKSLPDIQFIKNLLEYSKIYVNWQNSGGETALMRATYIGHTENVKLLLERPEILVNLKDILVGFSSFVWATKNGHTEIIELLKNKN